MLHPSMLASALLLKILSQPKEQSDTAPVIKVGSVWGFTLLDNLPFTVVKVTDDVVTTTAPLGEQAHNKETFLEFFTLLSNPTEQTEVEEETFGFAGALTALEEGQRVKRKDWEQGKYLFLVSANEETNTEEFICLHQANNVAVPYSVANDVLAKDWVLV